MWLPHPATTTAHTPQVPAGLPYAVFPVGTVLCLHLVCLKTSSVSAPSLDMQSYDLMRLPPREATAEGDLTIPFQQSALKSTADQDPFFQHLKIRYVKAADTADHPQVCCIICGCRCLGKCVWVSSCFGLVVCKTAAGGLTQIRESRKWWWREGLVSVDTVLQMGDARMQIFIYSMCAYFIYDCILYVFISKFFCGHGLQC